MFEEEPLICIEVKNEWFIVDQPQCQGVAIQLEPDGNSDALYEGIDLKDNMEVYKVKLEECMRLSRQVAKYGDSDSILKISLSEVHDKLTLTGIMLNANCPRYLLLLTKAVKSSLQYVATITTSLLKPQDDVEVYTYGKKNVNRQNFQRNLHAISPVANGSNKEQYTVYARYSGELAKSAG
uniref:Uncharacterized protein n=1 Tax=Glossina austeni TaxID=7395 RepID=A0A1A9VQK1_GLOAU